MMSSKPTPGSDRAGSWADQPVASVLASLALIHAAFGSQHISHWSLVDETVDLTDAWLKVLVERADAEAALIPLREVAAAAETRTAQVHAYTWNLTQLGAVRTSLAGAKARHAVAAKKADQIGRKEGWILQGKERAWFAAEAKEAGAMRRALEEELGELEEPVRREGRRVFQATKGAEEERLEKMRSERLALEELVRWAAAADELEKGGRLLAKAESVGGGGARTQLHSKLPQSPASLVE